MSVGEAFGCALVVLLGAGLVAAALNPSLPVLRGLWVWHGPALIQRQGTAIGGLLLIAGGVGLFVYLLIGRAG